ncbi:MAG: hypothetical protein ACRDVP_11280 [Acidimicrobiales bacterium]
MSRLAALEPVVASTGALDLADLVLLLRQAIGDASATWAPAVVQAMLRSESADPLIARAMLQALLPGLVNTARRLSWGAGGEWTDGGAFFSDLIATAWEVIAEWSGEDRPYALLDLLSAIRCRMRRAILGGRHKSELLLGDDIYLRFQSTASVELTDLDLLATTIQDLSGSEIDPPDAAIVYGTRVLGLTLTELANMTGRSRRFLTEHRRRAEAQLTS